MKNREDEQPGIPISLQVPAGGSIAAMASGEVTWDIVDAWVENMSNVRVTRLSPGDRFRVMVQCIVQWPTKPFWIVQWVVGVTAVGSGVQVYDNTNVGNNKTLNMTGSSKIALDNPAPAIMPNVSRLALKITGWANESSVAYYSSPPWN